MQLDIAFVRRIDRMVRTKATYKHDSALKDTWTSYAKDVLGGQRFEGDCDDWASTALALAVHYGAAKDRLYRALVSSTGEAIDHFIGIVDLDDGSRVTLGDTFGPPAAVRGDRAGPHKLIETSRISEGLRWRKFRAGRTLGRETTTAAMEMRTSEAGKSFIKGYERFVGFTYDDKNPGHIFKGGAVPRGVLTNGYGHTGADVQPDQRVSRAEGDATFEKDLIVFERGVRRLVRVELKQCQFDALISFAFNCGAANLAKSTLLKKINALAPVNEIQREFRKWTRSGGEVMAGLVARRNHEASMWAGEVVTAGAVNPLFHSSDITPEAVVEEDSSARKSGDIWGLAGATGLGSVSVLTKLKDVFQEFQDMVAGSPMTILATIAGVVTAVIAGVLLYKRLREIMVNARR